MNTKFLLAAAMFVTAFTAGALPAITPDHFKLDKLLASDSVADMQDPSINLYWGDQVPPVTAERARPDVYSRSSISLSPFGGSTRHCVDAFEKALKATIEDARARGYDVILGLRVLENGKPSADPDGFDCKPGYKTTEVALSSTFAMTPSALRRQREAEADAASAPARPAAAGAIYLPLGPILESQAAAAVLGPDLRVHWGLAGAPVYRERYGPDVYSDDDADPRKLGDEGACRQAVLNVLGAMVQDAKDHRFDSIIKVRSALHGRYAPVATDVECQLDKKSASVTLRASLASVR